MSDDQKLSEQQSDSRVDAVAGVVLVLMFVVVMRFWVMGQ